MTEGMGIYLTAAVLLVAVIVAAVRLYQYKQQIKSFTVAVRKHTVEEYNQPVAVDYFNRDIVGLANALNEYMDLQKSLALQYAGDRRQLNNVIAGISHDFRTPLTAAKGYLQLLEKNGDLSDEDREYLHVAMKKITYLKLLSDDFFEISALEAKGEDLESSAINLGNFLSECILQQYDWMERKGLKTSFLLPETDVFLETNEHCLKRMVENLFSNVRKYAKGYIGLRAVCERKQVVLVMENDLEDETDFDVSQVFEPFYRGRSRSNEGSGLGLYVVKCLAEQLGYSIQAEYAEGMFRINVTIKRN
ncbi:MAG: HAMP domain-containing histidine kinase [Bacteroidales bacterium]|nr:HAMP domain-containing histidine kinase [Clostridium sp.]MCM1204588.1 HAMP domain-containing histidine kinase [Bacteroidales bacterium]